MHPSQHPLIALPAYQVHHKTKAPTYEVQQSYLNAVLAAGGLPVSLPSSLALMSIPELVERFDGFLFMGGGDLDPTLYGGKSLTAVYGIDAERDAFELALVAEVLRQSKPLFAICRGVQVLNVALGGTLYADVATQVPSAGKHDWFPDYERNRLSHAVDIHAGTKLADILQADKVQVNSLHHQALAQIALGLTVSATAEDGIIEAVELAGEAFVLGVQWHPEWLQGFANMRALFQAFVQSA